MAQPQIDIPKDKIADFCRRWKITEFSLFGSVLRDDFRPDSDVDVLVGFQPDAHWTLLDLAQMQEELERVLGHKVDLLTRRGVEQSRNALRRQAILSTAEVVYES
jgi:predicted nucleotidyltransferase